MSRIDEALRRASGVAFEDPKPADVAERLNETDGAVLHHYPSESGVYPIRSGVPEPLAQRVASVPRPLGLDRHLSVPAGLSGKLVVSERAAPLAVEQYRRLAGTIHEIQVERGLKTLMVTSSLPDEGKTLTVSNLALTLSESYRRRVLLIDADLRRPLLHEVFGVGNEQGLGEVLRSTGVEIPFLPLSEHLTILPAGRADQPMEALTSDAMRLLLERCAANFDWVLLDAPPVGIMPDARLLAGLTRAVLFVIGAGTTPHTVVTRALAEFDPDSVIGTVLNRVEENDIPATGYYRDYYATARPAD